jgi:murein DD-endopeptidase MepM/ murein hydrolase activator NlpD
LQETGQLHGRSPGLATLLGRMKVHSTPLRALVAACAVVIAACLVGSSASGQDLQTRLQHKKDRLEQVNNREGVLSTTISKYGDQIDALIGQIAVLRNRVALVEQNLSDKQAELHADRIHLVEVHRHLHRSLGELRNRLVDIYRSGQPDMLTVILDSRGFDDLLDRYEYLKRIEQQDADVIDNVRTLRNDVRDTVDRVEGERDAIAARKQELVRTQSELESRQSDLDAARANQQAALDSVKGTEKKLEGDVSQIQGQITAQIQAAQQAAGVPAPPAGPYQGESSQGFIWPVNGPITSPFCEQRAWESCHPGIDIGVPSGTPIHAAANGVVLFTQSEAESGGYGNFTCIDHGGGISTCYAHQMTFEVSQGETVKQGQEIGISDCTGLCFGPHLHFEVRINGTVTDPMAYLP